MAAHNLPDFGGVNFENLRDYVNHIFYETWVRNYTSPETNIQVDITIARRLSHCISTWISTEFLDTLYKWGPYFIWQLLFVAQGRFSTGHGSVKYIVTIIDQAGSGDR